MLTYKAMFKFVDGGVHAEVVDFPGVISCGEDLENARRNLACALTDLAETHLLAGEVLPLPKPELASDQDPDLEEPIHLLLQAASRLQIIPDVRAS